MTEMTPAQFKEARQTLGLSQADLAAEWSMGANGGRTVRRWESGDRPVNPIAAYCIKLMLDRA
jgi:DNA-binding transcriptional regulator YiaG